MVPISMAGMENVLEMLTSNIQGKSFVTQDGWPDSQTLADQWPIRPDRHAWLITCIYMPLIPITTKKEKEQKTYILHQQNEEKRGKKGPRTKMIHIPHIYKTPLHSSPELNEPLHKFWIISHTALQKFVCRSSGFSATYWPWIKAQIILTGVNL